MFVFNVQNQSGKCDSFAEHGRKPLIEPQSPLSFWWVILIGFSPEMLAPAPLSDAAEHFVIQLSEDFDSSFKFH